MTTSTFIYFGLSKFLFSTKSGFATKYHIDIPVNDSGDVLHDLVVPKKQKCNNGKINTGLKCLLVTPTSYEKQYRYRNEELPFEDFDEHLRELALPLHALARTASGKEVWWTQQMKKLVEGI